MLSLISNNNHLEKIMGSALSVCHTHVQNMAEVMNIDSDISALICFLNVPLPSPSSFCLFSFFSTTILKKNYGGIRTRIEHADHLSSTTATNNLLKAIVDTKN